MLSFRDISLRRKQTLIIMLTSSIVLLLACAAFSVYEVIAFRSAMTQNVATLADIVDHNTTAALDFNDPKSAEETLSALQAEPAIIGAWLYAKDGQPFAKYDRPNDDIVFTPPAMLPNGTIFQGRRLILCRPVVVKGESLGTLYLEMDMRALSARLTRYVLIMVLVFLASLMLAFILSSKLQRLISGPILRLAQVARSVAQDKNYSVRATKHSNDELGQLVDGFNEMLGQIQARDAALQRTHIELEKRVEERTEELANSLSLLHATLESTADGIMVADGQGQVTSFNEKFITMWRIPREVAQSNDEKRMLDAVLPQLTSPKRFVDTIQELYGHPDKESFDVLEFNDGRIFERYSKPQCVGEKSVGRVWNFRDVTLRKKSEADLENTHKQLVATSRQAGMAEVATSVLHNVGNVLNSVNISSSLVSEKVRKSKVGNLAKASALIQSHASDLAGFFTSDPKGRQLPDYLSGLSIHLADEQEEIVQELASLTRNIEHIKEIVAMQQSYARISGVTEAINVADLVEDALRMNAGAMERHHVRVIRDFGEAPPVVTVDKHKVLQILVNLIRNAKYALDDGMPVEKRMVLRIGANGARTVNISIIDNGIGIPPENLTRIFGHGFTTRKEGHGFGLHSGALAAKELGGALMVHSDGTGKGATFTLEFPRQPGKEENHE